MLILFIGEVILVFVVQYLAIVSSMLMPIIVY